MFLQDMVFHQSCGICHLERRYDKETHTRYYTQFATIAAAFINDAFINDNYYDDCYTAQQTIYNSTHKATKATFFLSWTDSIVSWRMKAVCT